MHIKFKPLLIAACLIGVAALAAEGPVCRMAFIVGTARSTGSWQADGGFTNDGGVTSPDTACTWAAGSNVMMECTSSVYYRTHGVPVRYADGGTEVTAANSTNQVVAFNENPQLRQDPYIVYLEPNEKYISVMGVVDAGSCNFAITKRPKPWAR